MRAIDADAFKADHGMKDDCADCEKEMRGKTKACEYDRIYSKMDFCGWLDDAPTIEPQRKKGKWIYGESEAGNDGYYCSKCGNFVPWKYDEYDIDFIKEFLFCNKCGAEMEGQDE